jgi:NADH-quinone oxidoreductase subunit A
MILSRIVLASVWTFAMPLAYIPELIFALLVLAFPVLALLILRLIRRAHSEPLAHAQPESGVPEESNARNPYLARFFIVAMLFVILEVETIFLIPWAILFRSSLLAGMGGFALMSMIVFAGILLVGYVWLYKKGALNWT